MPNEDSQSDIEEIEIRADGSIRTGQIKREFRCCWCTMLLPEMQRFEKSNHCKSCAEEYY